MQLIPALIFTLTANVLSIFNLLRTFLEMDLKSLSSASIQFTWCLYCTFFMVFAIYMAHSSKKCGQHTAVILHNIANNAEENQLLNKLSWFSKQIHHRPSQFTCGFFDIDWTLAFAVSLFILLESSFITGYFNFFRWLGVQPLIWFVNNTF